MKCNQCNSQWDAPAAISNSMRNCPFCGAPLLSEKKQLNTTEDVLVEIHRQFGMAVLTDEKKLLAYFSDLAPQFSGHKRILRYFVECGGHKKFAAVKNASPEEQDVCVQQVIREMNNTLFIDAQVCREICDAFLFAVCGRHFSQAPAAVITAPPQPVQSTPPQPVTPPAPRPVTPAPSAPRPQPQQQGAVSRAATASIQGPMALWDAIRTLEDLVETDETLLARIQQYKTIFKTTGRYRQRGTQYGVYYFSVNYYVQNDTVYAPIDYTGFAGSYPKPGIARCEASGGTVTIEATGINKHTGKPQQFLFRIDGNTVDVTGSGGFSHYVCDRVK